MIELGGNAVRRRDRRGWYLVLAIFVAVFIFTFSSHFGNKMSDNAGAADLGKFDPGYIMSDYQMGNYNSMNVAEIQAFLKSKNACNDTALWKSDNNIGYMTEAGPYAWHVQDGHYVCMADENFNGQSAAEIIYEAAQDYRINPQVLIVLLQKEQGLITDTFPNSIQYRSATGYGCPDTAACSSVYYGFRNQIRRAAEMFRTVLDGGWTNYPLGNNYVQFNPNAACGGTIVNIRSLATSALYRYTPYQPNASVLAAGYGYGDGCGAYGNRNFYLYFEDWFGGSVEEGATTSEATVEDGKYNIVSKVNEEFALSEGDDNIVNSSKRTTWTIQWDKSGYTIKNNADLYLTFSLNSYGGYEIELSNMNSAYSNQLWNIEYNSDGTVTVSPTGQKSIVLDVENANDTDGTRVQLYEKVGENNLAQKWIIKDADTPDLSGEYYIMSALYEDKAIDVSNASMQDGANLQIYFNSDGNSAQQWTIRKDKYENYYTIMNSKSGKVVDITNGQMERGANVQMYEPNGSCAQKWEFKQYIDGTYGIRNYCNDMLFLDIQDYQTNIQVYSYGGKDNFAQKWKLRKIEKNETQAVDDFQDGVYSIHPLLDIGKALDIENGLYANMTNVQIFSFWQGNAAQEWEIIKREDYYIIRNKYSKLALDAAGGVLGNNTNIWVYEENDSCAQRWMLQKQQVGEDNSYLIKNACEPQFVLDVQDYYKNIQLYTGWGEYNTAQKWVLNKIR